MASLLVLFIFSLIIMAPLFASIPDDKTYFNSNLSHINPHMNSTTQLIALNPFYQCDIYPRVCLAKGGVAPDCCKKKCVNVITDSLNCGSCGKQCKSGEACCKGRCVDVSTSRSNCGLCGMKCRYNESCCKGKCKNTYSDKRNCGACQNKCKNGESCAYGMCNYA
ncbi:putative stigma-specific protein Stig1 [Helianthus annuus]|nr:putative stigma-specific protein Stig1 [Helianthus annuus]KAJ0647639.1 putative stigma-specific protein Stig1 [Helianthus annuus]KAJ0830119.1 putative stigma-specific protein Stig1 [Helianthus annuus]KAJ0843485.1 putative stigma-specific protein Stig1 [Helianthus annuus]